MFSDEVAYFSKISATTASTVSNSSEMVSSRSMVCGIQSVLGFQMCFEETYTTEDWRALLQDLADNSIDGIEVLRDGLGDVNGLKQLSVLSS